MREYKKFVDAHKDVRCFIQIDSRDQKKIQLLEQEGWRRTQLVQQMDKGSLTRLLAEIHEQEPSTHIREAESFSEVRQQMADLHTLNASFNKQFTLASDGLQKFEQMYKETTNNNSGAWVVLKGDQQQTQGLMVLIKDGANNKIEVEAFIVAEELRTKPGMQNAGGNRPSHTLMREGLRIAQKKLGLNSETDVFLYVTEENQVAQKFYRKFDFRRIKELWDLPSSQDAPRDKLR
jgi:ribosomal protein S18 acetylase RimI-like enzyme